MSGNIDILKRLPDVAAIGRTKLQAYCDEWLQRPIAREFGISHLIVGSDLMLTANLDLGSVQTTENGIFIPIYELLDYIIDQHFTSPEERHRMHSELREVRQRLDGQGIEYGVTVGRLGTLYLTCKNPQCCTIMETEQQACEGQTITWGPVEIECNTCGQVYSYDGYDFRVKVAK